MPLRPSPISTVAVLCGAGYALIRLVPAPISLARHLRQPHSWIAQCGPDAAVASIAGALLWLCALWVTLGLVAVYLGTRPGLAGRHGRALARHVLPAAVRQLLAASAGASLLLSPLSATAATSPVTPSGPAVPSNPAAPGGTVPSWPLDQLTSTPAPSWPLDQDGPEPAGSPPTGPTPTGPTPTGTRKPAGTVTVTTGDSLWTIAATDLGPAATDRQIAVAWPYWYRANRAVIGRDPGLIRPGTELSVPAAPAAHPGD